MPFSREQLAAIAAVAFPVLGFVLSWAWSRWWRQKDTHADKAAGLISSHGDRLIVVEKRLDAAELREGDRQKAIGRLESDHSKLDGKVGGLQEFWRNEFGALRRELREDQHRLREELRMDQTGFEARVTTLLASHLEQERQERQQHQQRIHDRLNAIAADQAKLLTEFVDTLVERKGT